MSIVSPKLTPVVLTTNNNGTKNQSNTSPTSMKKDFNHQHTNNSARTSNGNGSKSNHSHKNDSPSKRKSRVIHSSEESDDDDKPLVRQSLAVFKNSVLLFF